MGPNGEGPVRCLRMRGLFFCFEIGSHCVAVAGLELTEIFLSLPLLSAGIKACPTTAGRRRDSYEFCFSSDLGENSSVGGGEQATS